MPCPPSRPVLVNAFSGVRPFIECREGCSNLLVAADRPPLVARRSKPHVSSDDTTEPHYRLLPTCRLRRNDRTDCASRCENGSWFNHVLEWWEAAKADPEHVMFLCYEQMLADPRAHIQKIADFIGVDCTPEILAKASRVTTRNAFRCTITVSVRGLKCHTALIIGRYLHLKNAY